MVFFGSVVTYTIAKGNVLGLLTIALLGDTFPKVSQATQTNIVCKSYALQEVDVPTYNFEAHKIVGVSSSRVMFRVHLPLCFMLKSPFAFL